MKHVHYYKYLICDHVRLPFWQHHDCGGCAPTFFIPNVSGTYRILQNPQCTHVCVQYHLGEENISKEPTI